ncbi:MAG: hypothetical protein L0Z53_03975 [Acidobacteriales bacterium]|nr:hypothetical protein [Terriglobales bacterium]
MDEEQISAGQTEESQLAQPSSNEPSAADLDAVASEQEAAAATAAAGVGQAPPADTQLAEAGIKGKTPVEINRHMRFLRSRGYATETVKHAREFVGNLTAQEQAGFFADADAWQEPPSTGRGAEGAQPTTEAAESPANLQDSPTEPVAAEAPKPAPMCRCGATLKPSSQASTFNYECPAISCKLRWRVTDSGQECIGRGAVA